MGKNQHYVPQFYLKLFSNDNKSIGTWISKDNKKIKNAPISSMASRNNLYGKDQILEKELSNFERDWSIAIKKILKTNKIDNPYDLSMILTFISISTARTLKKAEESNYMANYFSKLMLSGKISKDEFDEININLDIPNLQTMQIAAEQTVLLADLKPLVIENYTSASFITSDNPVCYYNKFYVERNYDRNYGLGASGLIIFLPLSPQKCLCFYDPLVYNGNVSFTITSTSQATQINKLLAKNAYYNIFYNNQQKESYINSIVRHHKYISSEQCVKEHFGGALIQISSNSILDKFQINFLETSEKYKTIKLPSHMGGLMRPHVKNHLKSDKDYIDNTDDIFDLISKTKVQK